MKKKRNQIELGNRVIVGDPCQLKEEKPELDIRPGLYNFRSTTDDGRVRRIVLGLDRVQPAFRRQASFNCLVESGHAGIFIAQQHPEDPLASQWFNSICSAVEDEPHCGITPWGVVCRPGNGDYIVRLGWDAYVIVEISINFKHQGRT